MSYTAEQAVLRDERRKAENYLARAKTPDKVAKATQRLLNANRAITVESLDSQRASGIDRPPPILIKHKTDRRWSAGGQSGRHEFELLFRLFAMDGGPTYVLVKVISETGRPPFEGADTPRPGSYKIGFGSIPYGEDATDWGDPDFMVAKDAYLAGRMNEFADMLNLNIGTDFEALPHRRV